MARGEFSIVIAGLAVATEPRIGPIATAYVLILVIVGPLTARWTQPAVEQIRKWRGKDDSPAGKAGTGPAAPVPAPKEEPEPELAASADTP